jgi:hypothetical protein
MGRFWDKIKGGIKKVGRFIGRVAGKVGNVAGVLSNIPVIGSIASTVARGANLVSKIGNGAANLIEKGEKIKQRYQPTIDKVKDAAQAVHQSRVLDKITRGGMTRFLDKGRALRDRMERRYDHIANQAQRIGQRVEAGVDKAGAVAQKVVR